MLSIESVNYDIVQGSTWQLTLTITDSATPPVPIDLTGYNFIMTVRDRDGGSVICATVSLGSGIIVIEPGTIHIELTPAQTKNFSLPRAAYEIISIDGSLRRKILGIGWFKVKAGSIL